MDLYRALNADVPQLLLTVMHQPRPTISREDYQRMMFILHEDMREQFQVIEHELDRWLKKHYIEEAEETVRKLQRLASLSEHADVEQVQEILIRDYSRLGSKVGSLALVGVQGFGEEVMSEEMPRDPDLASNVAAAQKHLASIGFQPLDGALHEMWLLFRGSVHYDILEHVVRSRLSSFGTIREGSAHIVAGMYELIYQIGEGLTAELKDGIVLQEVTVTFGRGKNEDVAFRQEVAALMEEAGENEHLYHASFWQRKPGLDANNDFVLRMRLTDGEPVLLEMMRAIAGTGKIGRKMIVKRGRMMFGKRIL
ncbi:MAG: hypothetical protein E6J04_03940 [Chloroflexi bacterium]|nr:MAG: hypothetical protein E6J36_01840 [Chloroflexota bacterium]TMC92001.1 MAG: hypothetical protein E6J22_10250 [Chloroflexota bacterium]TMD37445.1 MAG: hypothetical protein E6J04_03940 [Chloroflexota bacterium]